MQHKSICQSYKEPFVTIITINSVVTHKSHMVTTPAPQLTRIKPLKVHVDSRMSPYPGTDIKRYTVPDEKVNNQSEPVIWDM